MLNFDGFKFGVFGLDGNRKEAVASQVGSSCEVNPVDGVKDIGRRVLVFQYDDLLVNRCFGERSIESFLHIVLSNVLVNKFRVLVRNER